MGDLEGYRRHASQGRQLFLGPLWSILKGGEYVKFFLRLLFLHQWSYVLSSMHCSKACTILFPYRPTVLEFFLLSLKISLYRMFLGLRESPFFLFLSLMLLWKTYTCQCCTITPEYITTHNNTFSKLAMTSSTLWPEKQASICGKTGWRVKGSFLLNVASCRSK